MLRLVYDNTNMDADLLCTEATGTDTTRALDTAVLLSILVDARASELDDIPAGIDRRGWWADIYEDSPWGSKLWQAFLMKATDKALVFARETCEESLRWMIDDGIASAVTVETWWLEGRQGYMGILVTLTRPGEVAPQYIGPWETYYAVD